MNLKYDDLFQPLLNAIKSLGGSATVSEQQDKVATDLKLSEEELNEFYSVNRTKFNYRLAWARYYLKAYGLIENSQRGVWRLTKKGEAVSQIDRKEIKAFVNNRNKNELSIDDFEPLKVDITWQEQLSKKLKTMSPKAFEKLCQRLLREAGFEQVEVIGRSGDGGIDGKGLLKLNGFLSFYVYFQCKRYVDSVAPTYIRDFRGAIIGRADRGLFITTGSFTKAAREEAIRDGATPIDLIDGDILAEKMRELKLGVNVEISEKITIDDSFFEDYF